jgi:hypothetical protein
LPEANQGNGIEVQFESAPRAPAKGPPAKHSPKPSPAPTQPTEPTKQPIAENTAPPPPPPPAPVHAEAAQPVPTPPAPKPPPPTPPAPTPLPTPPVPIPPPPAPKPTPTPAVASIPTPPEPVAAPPSQSTTSQPNKTTNPANDSNLLENTLAKLRSTTKSAKAPTAKANPESGGALEESGNPNSDDTSALTASQNYAIGDAVRPCWNRDPGALGADQMKVMLQVVTDAGGIVRQAQVTGDDVALEASSPAFRAFAERAVRALLDAKCATLPLPPEMLGKTNTFSFRFSP